MNNFLLLAASLFLLIGCDLFKPIEELPLKTLTFDGNGSESGILPSQPKTYKSGDKIILPSNSGLLTKTGFSCIGWNTQKDGAGIRYTTNQVLTFGTTDIVLYAQWSSNPAFLVLYNGNGNESGTAPFDMMKYETGDSVILALNSETLAKTNGEAVIGWNDGSKSCEFGGRVIMGTANKVINALWSPPCFTLKFSFINFPKSIDSANGDNFLVGAFTKGWYSPTAYPISFTNGNSETLTILGQTTDLDILFKLTQATWGTPTGVNYATLEPNAWDALPDDHAYSGATDPFWGVGTTNYTSGTGQAYPVIPWKLNSTHFIEIDAKNGAGRAKLSIDGISYWGN